MADRRNPLSVGETAFSQPMTFTDPMRGANGVNNFLGINPNRNMLAARSSMGLSPEEIALYQHHINNLQQGGVQNSDGSTSTLYQLSFQDGDRTYNIPTIYGNTRLDPEEAIARAYKTGLQNFPSYKSPFAAENRYNRMHGYMEMDEPSKLERKR
jgi:hypothetical protein